MTPENRAAYWKANLRLVVGCLVTKEGNVEHAASAEALGLAKPAATEPEPAEPADAESTDAESTDTTSTDSTSTGATSTEGAS